MKILQFLLICFLVIFIFGCSKDSNELDNSEKNVEIDLRHDTWDQTSIFDPCEVTNLYVCADPCFLDTPWQCAIEGAIEKYNNLPSSIPIKMTLLFDCSELPQGEIANIVIDCAVLSGATGRTFPRSDPDGTSRIELNTNTPTRWPCRDQRKATCCQLTRTVMHEMGHALGFGHSEPGDTNEFVTETYIEGTDKNDENSVFIMGENREWCDDECEFSEGDVEALEIIYGCGSISPILTVSGDLNPGQVVEITSDPQGVKMNYSVWAVFDGISTRFLVHEQCSDQMLTTSFQLEDDPLMECNMRLYVEQCNEITTDLNFSLGSITSIYPAINDYYPQLGEEVEINSTSNGQADYIVRIKYELYGQVQYQNISDITCGSSSSDVITLWDNPDLAYKTLVIEGVRNGNVLGSHSFTIYP